MTNREKLIELLINFNPYKDPIRQMAEKMIIEKIADYLLANGVIAPPCNVGDKAYFVLKFDDKWEICEETVVDFSTKGFYYSEFLDGTGGQILVPYEEIGENVFFDKLQAEAKLKELNNNA